MSVGASIRRYRKKANLTQEQLAKKVGLSPAAIRLYELGKRNPKEETVLALAKLFDVSPEAFKDHKPTSSQEALASLFGIGDAYGLRPEEVDGNIVLTIDGSNPDSKQLSRALKVWKSQLDALEDGSITDEDYLEWKDKVGLSNA